MRITSKTRYGLLVLLDLVLNQDEGPVGLGDVSRRQGISRKYLWQVLTPLKLAGLLRARRGLRGGYVLARPPREITLLEVVSILEGPAHALRSEAGDAPGEADLALVTDEAWAAADAAAAAALRGITLENLTRKLRERQSRAAPSYAI